MKREKRDNKIKNEEKRKEVRMNMTNNAIKKSFFIKFLCTKQKCVEKINAYHIY